MMELSRGSSARKDGPPPYAQQPLHYHVAEAPVQQSVSSGTQGNPIDLSEDEDSSVFASVRPAGQKRSAWDNEYLMEKHSMSQLFKVDSIHPDDLCGKLFAILKREPHSKPNDYIIAKTRECYARHHLRLPTIENIRERIQDAEEIWNGKAPRKAKSRKVSSAPPSYEPPQYELSVPEAQQTMQPPPTYPQLVQANADLLAQLQATRAQLAASEEELGRWRASFRPL